MAKYIKGILVLLLTCLVVLVPVSAKSVYPLKTDATLTYWMELHQNTALITTNFGDLPLAKELEKRTGIKVKYIHPPVASQAVGPTGRATEAFNLMVASGELPDIIEFYWRHIPGGPTEAIKNGIIQTERCHQEMGPEFTLVSAQASRGRQDGQDRRRRLFLLPVPAGDGDGSAPLDGRTHHPSGLAQ